MKKLLALFLILTLLIGLVPAVFADEGTLTENGGFETRFYRGQPKTWNFTPSQTGDYLLFLPSNGSLIGQIVGQTPTDTYTAFSGQTIQVYSLTGGTTYQVKIEMNPAEAGDYVFDAFNIDRKRPLERLTLSETSMTVHRDESWSVYVDLEPNYYPLTDLKWTSSDESILSISSAEGNTCNFWLNKVGTATITATLGSLSASCTVTVEKATGYWDSLTVWPADQTEQKFSLTGGNGTSLSYTPSQTGTYALHTDGGIHVMIHGTSPSHMLNHRTAITMFGDYELVDLIAGETYVVGISSNPVAGDNVSGTTYIEKAKDPTDITLYGPNLTDASTISGYVGGMKDIMAISDPIYAYALHGNFTFESPNSAIASWESTTSEGSNHVLLNGAGQCNISISTGGITKRIPVTVKPSPVLKVGQTTTLEFGPYDAYGVTCLFTPESSGNYTFTIKGAGGTCYIEDTEIGNYVYGSGSMSGWLQGGKTYEVVLFVGESNHSISVSGGGSSTDEPTEPTDPTESTSPSNPTESTEPTDPTAPQNPTEPSDPALTNPILENLAALMGGSVEGENIRINKDSNTVNLSANLLEQLAQTGGALIINGQDFVAKLDSNVLNAIVGADQENMTLQVQSLTKDRLSQAQQAALTGKNAALVVDITLSAGDISIHDFAGGIASVTVPFAPEKDKDYAVYYLAEDGTLEKITASYTDDSLTFTTGHFSQYVVLEAEKSADIGTGTPADPESAPRILKLLPYLLIAVAVAAGIVVTVLVLKKKKK